MNNALLNKITTFLITVDPTKVQRTFLLLLSFIFWHLNVWVH